MKKHLIVFCALICAGLESVGQPTNIFTCRNTAIAANIQSAGTSAQITTWTNQYLTWAAGNSMSAANIIGRQATLQLSCVCLASDQR